MSKRLSGVLCAVLTLLSFNVHAVTIDFESLEQAGTGQPIHGSSYMEDDFTITVASGNLHTNALGNPLYIDSTAMFFGLQGVDGTLTADLGSAFSLSSIDLRKVNLIPGPTSTLTFTGFLLGGGTVTQDFTLSGNTSFNTFNFDSRFDNLTKVVWRNSDPFHEFDNIVVSTVPVPAAVWLFGSGLLGLIGLSRRR